MAITNSTVMNSAALLLSDDGENTEYDRAIVELTIALTGGASDDREDIERMLRMLKS